MKTFVDWLSDHAEVALLVVVSIFAIGYVFAHRKSLFYRE